MRILVTGFDPFGGEQINPAWEAVKLIEENIEGVELIKHQIPTVFRKSAESLFSKIEEVKPDVVLCVGQAGGRFEITPERVAINIDDARIADNEGNQPIDLPVYEDGDNAYFTTVPVKAMVDRMNKANIPASVSNTAGTFVCNHIIYSLLYYIKKNNLNIKGGFVHVPYIPEQVINKKGQPYMGVANIARGLGACIEAIRDNDTDIKLVGGKEF